MEKTKEVILRNIRFNKEELNLILDGCQDTLHRLKFDAKVDEPFDTYTKRVIILMKRIERKLNERDKK